MQARMCRRSAARGLIHRGGAAEEGHGPTQAHRRAARGRIAAQAHRRRGGARRAPGEGRRRRLAAGRDGEGSDRRVRRSRDRGARRASGRRRRCRCCSTRSSRKSPRAAGVEGDRRTSGRARCQRSAPASTTATPEQRTRSRSCCPSVGGRQSLELALEEMKGQRWEHINKVALSARRRGEDDGPGRAQGDAHPGREVPRQEEDRRRRAGVCAAR